MARREKNWNRVGANFELQIMEHLRVRGYDVLRSSGSRGKVDVVGVGDCHLLFVQAKISQPVIPPAERKAVRAMALRALAVPLVAYRVSGKVCFRRLTGDGPKAFELFHPEVHGWVRCVCGYQYDDHDSGGGLSDSALCPGFTIDKDGK